METTILKVKKTFQYEGIDLQIVERNEPYMNSETGVNMTRVIAPNGGVIPVVLERKDTLKKIIEKTADLLDNFKKRGADVQKELTKAMQ